MIMYNSQEKQDLFFHSLASLSIIQQVISNYAMEIVAADNPKKEKELVKKRINDLIVELKKSHAKVAEEEDLFIITSLLYTLFERQMPLTKLSEKIRKLKNNPPDSFK